MAQRYSLSAEVRTIIGKQVKQLRRQGLVPANIYGHNVPATAVSLVEVDFARVYREAGETGLIDLQIAEEKAARPTLIHSLLQDPASGRLLHVDFYQVNLREKLTTAVPLEFIGEAPVVKTNEGILLELLQEVEIECLPTNIPQTLQVDISGLTAIDQGIHTRDLPLPEGVELLTDRDELVCKIEPAQMSEEEVEGMSTPAAVAEGEVENSTNAADAE